MYALRMLPVLGLATLPLYLSGAMMGRMSQEQALQAMGTAVANAALTMQALVLLIVTPVLGAGLVAQEREEGTLGLLVLADQRLRDVFLAKYLSLTATVWLLLISALPLLAAAAYMGGISVPLAALRLALMLASALLISALTMLGAVSSATTAGALTHALFWVLLAHGGLVLLGLMASVGGVPVHLSAFVLAVGLPDLNMDELAPAVWVPPFLLTLLLAGAAVGLAMHRFARVAAMDKADVPVKRRGRAFWDRAAAILRRPMAPPRKEPVGRAATLNRFLRLGIGTTTARQWVRLALLAFLVAASWLPLTFLGYGVGVLVLYEIVSGIRTLRSSRMYEEAMLTQVQARAFLRALHGAFMRDLMPLALLWALLPLAFMMFRGMGGRLDLSIFLSCVANVGSLWLLLVCLGLFAALRAHSTVSSMAICVVSYFLISLATRLLFGFILSAVTPMGPSIYMLYGVNIALYAVLTLFFYRESWHIVRREFGEQPRTLRRRSAEA